MTLPQMRLPAPDTLITVQQWLSNAITFGEFDKETAKKIITSSRTLDPQARLNAYLDDYWPRCFESLTDDYPRTARYLGKEWESLCRHYLHHCPSNQFTLFFLGQRLPQFAQTQPLDLWTKNLIKLEWGIMQAEIFNQVEIGQILETSPIYLQPHTSVLSLDFPLNSLLNERKTNQLKELVVVYQSNNEAEYKIVDPLFSPILSEFSIGKSLPEIFDSLCTSGVSETDLSYIAANIQSWITTAIQYRWITSIKN